MSLSREEVEHIARLARLALTDQEIEIYRGQLSAILDSFARLQTLDTNDILPTLSILPQGQESLRPDEPRPSLARDVLLRNAPETEANQFRVPPILE